MKPSVIESSIRSRRFDSSRQGRRLALPLDLGLGLSHGPASVVLRVGLILGSIISDALDDLIGMVAAAKRSLGVGPIRFGLALVSSR